MSTIINTNSLSLLTQNNLSKSQADVNSAIQRLSSGLRINSAKDDAAGQAIANRFTANIKGLSQAQRNSNDGISLAQTTEGALNEVNNNLQRIRELAVQSANGSNSQSDLASIQGEITQRLAEVDRTSKQTDFNGTKVLSKDSSLAIQVGTRDAETIGIDLKQIDRSTLGFAKFSVAGPESALGSTAAVSAASVTAFLGKTTTAANIAVTASTGTADLGTTPALTGNAFQDDKGNFFAEVKAGANPTRAGVAENDLLYVAIDPKSVVITPGTGTAIDTAAVATVDFTNATFKKSTGQLATLDAAISKVDTFRGSLGAVQNRFESIISNLGTTITNLSSSRSRIEDADYATEVSNLTRAQILQQAGTSVLAKANQSTEGVLSLLR